MTKLLSDVFDSIGLKYYRQGSLTKDLRLPSTYFTYWNVDSPFADYGDNRNHSEVHQYYVYCYSCEKQEDIKLREFIELAKTNGWIPSGGGQDAPSEDKRYIGRMVRIDYKENI